MTEAAADGMRACEHRDIAVVGMACRFPGADDVDEYWHNLINGVESIIELEGASSDPSLLPFAAPLNQDVFDFDADFFGIRPREASLLDPQHRMFLECAWHAMESAGLQPRDLKPAGLFAGCSSSAYLPRIQSALAQLPLQASEFELQLANDKDYLASRVAWQLGIEGPVMGVQAACATSLVAVAQAVDALRAGRCELALAGACTLRLPQREGYAAQSGMIYSRDGHCRPFSAAASGTVFGSGVALVVLQPLALARAAGRPVMALIKGCAVNNDGADKVGFTATSRTGQRRLLALALADAGVQPAQLRCIEAHGTGTPAGDPIEIEALRSLFPDTVAQRCALGAVKANIGHLETCAGMAGLIKGVLQIQHGWICPQIYRDAVHPALAGPDAVFQLPARAMVWAEDDARMAMGVSAFGIGGTNAHVVLARPEAVPAPAVDTHDYPRLVPVSAASAAACRRLQRLYPAALARGPARDVAWSTQTMRAPMRYRSVWRLDAQGHWQAPTPVRDRGRHRPLVVFQFPGQGSQFSGMAAGLAAAQPQFARRLGDAADRLQALSGVDIHGLLQGGVDEATAMDTAWGQPALVAVQLALAGFLGLHGLTPDAVLGHSLGEVAAACVAGRWSDDEALAFAAQRGRLMATLPEGAMLAVALSEPASRAWCNPDISLAAVNADASCVLSGSPLAVHDLQQRLREAGIRCRRLRVSRAFHSAMMDPILPALAEVVPAAAAGSHGIDFHSALRGGPVAAEAVLGADYWVDHARQPVRYGAALQALPLRSGALLLEIGPGATLTALSRQARSGDSSVQTLAGADDTTDDASCWLQALEQIWLAGVDMDWRPSWRRPGQCLRLPAYPFASQRHSLLASSPAPAVHPEPEPEPDAASVKAASPFAAYASAQAAAQAVWLMATGQPVAGTAAAETAEFDSLLAIQLALLAERELGIELTVSELLRQPDWIGFRDCVLRAEAAIAKDYGR